MATTVAERDDSTVVPAWVAPVLAVVLACAVQLAVPRNDPPPIASELAWLVAHGAAGVVLRRLRVRRWVVLTVVVIGALPMLVAEGRWLVPGLLRWDPVSLEVAAFAVVPAALLAAVATVRPSAVSPHVPSVPVAAGTLVVAGVAWWGGDAAGGPGATFDVARVDPLLALLVVAAAAFAGSARRGALLAAGVAAALWSHDLAAALAFGRPLVVLELVAALGPVTVVALGIGALDRGRLAAPVSGDRTLLVTANLLNILDAGLTWLLLARGTGAELNPVIDVIGLPGKVVLVLVLTLLLHRIRPAALRLVVVALAAVTAYHLTGIVVSGI